MAPTCRLPTAGVFVRTARFEAVAVGDFRKGLTERAAGVQHLQMIERREAHGRPDRLCREKPSCLLVKLRQLAAGQPIRFREALKRADRAGQFGIDDSRAGARRFQQAAQTSSRLSATTRLTSSPQ